MGLHSHCSPRSWSTSPSAALGLECIVPSLGAVDGGLCHPAEVNPAVEVGVAAHVDAAPERGVVARGVVPGAAHLRVPREDLDVVEPGEDGRERVQRPRRPAPSLLVALRSSDGVGFGAAGPDLRAKAAGGGSYGGATGPLARATAAGAPVAWRQWLLRGGRACERRRRAGAATTVGGGVDLKKGGGSGGDRRLR